MTIDPARIALFDLDGTLADWDGHMRDHLTRLLSPGETLPEQIHDEKLPWLKARMDVIKRQTGWWKNLPVFQLGWNVLNMARSIGFDISILTKGPYNTTSAWTEKVEWCRERLPHVKVTITEDKSMVYGRVLVDDWPEYVEPWLRVRPRGIVIMPAQPWNRKFRHERAVRYDGTNGPEVELALGQAFNREAGR